MSDRLSNQWYPDDGRLSCYFRDISHQDTPLIYVGSQYQSRDTLVSLYQKALSLGDLAAGIELVKIYLDINIDIAEEYLYKLYCLPDYVQHEKELDNLMSRIKFIKYSKNVNR